MSTPVGGGGSVRPLQPVTQPTPAQQQQQVENKTSAPQQAPARAGSTINNVNNFSSEPVSTDISQLQQWLNGLKNRDQPTQQVTQQTATPQQTQVTPQHQATPFVPVNNQVITQTQPEGQQTTFPAGPTGGIQEEVLSKTQKKKLHLGVQKLAERLGIKQADFARLTLAKATGDDSFYNYQLGKMGIPPNSSKGRMLEAGLNKLFTAVNAPNGAIADQVSKLVAVDDVGQMAKQLGIPSSLAVDLGALTNNEQDRFFGLAQAAGLPKGKAIQLLNGFQEIAQQYDMTAAELDNILGSASATVNKSLDKAMTMAADRLGLKPEVYNELANAALTKNTRQFAQVGIKAGFNQDQIKRLLPQISRSLTAIQAQPAFTGEKILRHSKDSLIQQQIENAGRNFGLSGAQSLQLAAALADEGLAGYVEQAKEFGMGRNSQGLLNQFEAIEQQHGKMVLGLATNNVDSIVSLRRMAKEAGLQAKPITWPVTKPIPRHPFVGRGRGPFTGLGGLGSILDNIRNKLPQNSQGISPTAQAQSETRYVMLVDKQRSLDKEIGQYEGMMRSPLFAHKLRGHFNGLKQQRNNVAAQIRSLEESGIRPSVDRIQEINDTKRLTELRGELKELEKFSNHPLMKWKLRGKINNLKSQIQNLERSLGAR